jgi:hypothetical protein
MLLPKTYQPAHQRDTSKSSSIYSEKRTSTVQSNHERNFSLPENAQRNSTMLKASKEPVATSSSALAPLPSHDATNDPRFSEFYDAYFRNSQLNFGLRFDAPGHNRVDPPPAITEVPSRLPSPQPPAPGMAV